MLASRFKKAFSLIEAAIVLGIVGLVIGGIWIAAETVSTNNKVNISSTYSHKIVHDLLRLYKGQEFPTSFTDLTPTLISANIIPPDMIANGAAVNVWGGAYEIIIPSAGLLRVTFYSVPQSACVKFVNASVTQIDPDLYVSREGIMNVVVGANIVSMNPSNFIRNAGNRCKLSATSTVMFTYDLNYIQ
jgi:hypothetical protein